MGCSAAWGRRLSVRRARERQAAEWQRAGKVTKDAKVPNVHMYENLERVLHSARGVGAALVVTSATPDSLGTAGCVRDDFVQLTNRGAASFAGDVR